MMLSRRYSRRRERTERFNIPVLRVDIVLGPAGAGTIDRQLADLEKIAGERSSGIALVQVYPATLERLRAWISALDARRYVLSPSRRWCLRSA